MTWEWVALILGLVAIFAAVLIAGLLADARKKPDPLTLAEFLGAREKD